MKLNCIRCGVEFENDVFIGYCQDCKSAFKINREGIHRKQRAMPNVCADGKFADEKTCPRSVIEPTSDRSVCGLCGCDDLQPGYGIGGGYGMGSYNYCE